MPDYDLLLTGNETSVKVRADGFDVVGGTLVFWNWARTVGEDSTYRKQNTQAIAAGTWLVSDDHKATRIPKEEQ